MGQTADLVIMGATPEVTGDGVLRADAVAVSGGRIAAIGSGAEMRGLVGASTEVIELAGETLLPGFQDAHIHPIHGGLLRDQCDLHGLTDGTAYPAAIASYAAAHPERDWITGGGWAMPAFAGGNPGRAALDAIVSDRPVFLNSRDGHSAWVNTRALELAAIGPGTPDPGDGRIERDAHGAPSGTLHEGAQELVRRFVPQPTAAELGSGLLAAQRYLLSLGITAWQDAGASSAELATYREAASEGRLTVRVVASQLWDNSRGLDQVPEFVAERDASTLDGLRAGTVKFFVDGIIENGTALMTEPYLERGQPTANRGMPMLDPAVLLRAVAELDRLGFQCHFHAIGDGAVRLALDAVAAARSANGMTDGRHHIAHLEVINPADIGRFAPLAVTANIQPIWATYDSQIRDLRIPVLGPKRTAWQYPFASLLRAGARLAGGSDWTVSTPNPLLEIEAAVTRVDADERSAEPFLPDERLELDVAVRAYTIGAAHVNHLDRETGTIEVGKAADLVTLDRNLRAPDGGPIGDARVQQTFVAGHPVYRA